MKTAYQILNAIARQAADADALINLIANEQPIDNAHYAQTESKRNTLCEVCKTIEAVSGMDAGQAELALNQARAALRESEDTRAINRAALAHFLTR